MEKKIEALDSEIVKSYGLGAGAELVGIASSSDFDLAPEGFRPSDNLDGCLSVIVLAAPSPKEVLKNSTGYTASRNAMLSRMTEIANEVAKKIKAHGYAVKAISASGGKSINGRLCGHISLKHAAELAGLGRINRNYLLTNQQYGNLLWLSAVLSDAELVPDKKAHYKICDKCKKCVESCPAGALDVPGSFGRKGCSKYFVIANKQLEIKCFMCRKVCPYRFGKNKY